MHRARLPIADPCRESFDAMDGDGAQRFCRTCRTHVHDLSQMTEREATSFLAQRQGETVCVRYRTDRAGHVRFVAAPPARTALATIALGLALAACTGHLEADALGSPEDALACEDASGYTIPCVDAIAEDTARDEAQPELERSPIPEDLADVQGTTVADEEAFVGQMVSPLELEVASMGVVSVVELAEPTDEGCPLPVVRTDRVDGPKELMGRVDPSMRTRAQARRDARQLRREARRRHRDR
jgi:hypothetical protein